MNQASFHTSYTPTQFANHSSRITREPRPRNSKEKTRWWATCASARRRVCRPSALTYSFAAHAPPTPNNLRILLSNPYRACSQENDNYDFDPQEDLIDQLHLDMGRIYATLRSSHGLASSRRWRVFRRPHGRVFLRQAGGAPRHRLSLNAEEYSMVVILRMNRAFIGVHAQAREGL